MRARRRLVGAVVLLAIGIVAFPMLFDSRPRPLALDTPIQVAQRDLQPPVAVQSKSPPARPLGSEPSETILESSAGPDAASSAAAAVPTAKVTGHSAPAAPPAPEPATKAVPAPPPVQTSKPPAAPGPTPAPTTTTTTAPRGDDGARARALLEGAPVPATALPASPTSERFVVQVGAYSEEAALRDARSRVERLGLKTYTQVIANDAGRRTRVRVGPFTNRAEADAAAAKLKRGGLPASVLTL